MEMYEGSSKLCGIWTNQSGGNTELRMHQKPYAESMKTEVGLQVPKDDTGKLDPRGLKAKQSIGGVGMRLAVSTRARTPGRRSTRRTRWPGRRRPTRISGSPT